MRASTRRPPKREIDLDPLPDPLEAPGELIPGTGGLDDDGQPTTTTGATPELLALIADAKSKVNSIGTWKRNPDGTAIPMTTYPATVIEAIHREWTAGLKSVHAISQEYGDIPRATIINWSKRYGWAPRPVNGPESTLSKVSSELLARAAKSIEEPVNPLTNPDLTTSERRALALSRSPTDPEERAQAMLDDYAAIVANVVQGMRDTSGKAVGVGRELLVGYERALKIIMEQFSAAPSDQAKAMVALSKSVTTYKAIVSALHTAYQLQRQSYGLDATDGNDKPPGAGPESLGGTYEDAVREAEERGVDLMR